MSEAVFDSNIVIDLLVGRMEGFVELQLYSGVLISVVTWIEVMAGVKPEEEQSLRKILAGYQRIDLSPDIAERAAVIRRERRIKLPDAIIQASAEIRGLTLVTRNEKDFPEGTPGVRVPYRL